MNISGTSAYQPGLSAIQTGQRRIDETAGQIASTAVERTATSQSSDYQAERLRSVDRSQQLDLATQTVQLDLGLYQVQGGLKVEKASDELLGRLIDIQA